MHIAGGDGVSVVGLDGVEIGHWGEKGSEPWQFIGGPHGVWIDSHGDIYVAQVIVDNGINKYARA
jgi:hypothetical protein